MSNASGGKLPASVYRRRRITVAVIAVVLVGLIIWGVIAVAGLFSSDQEGSAAPQATAQTSAPAESTQSEEDAAKKCKSDEVEVTATTDAKSYATGKEPVLILTVENTSKRECDINVGTNKQEFLISSGSDRVFSTVDCLQDGEDVSLTFAAGQKENARFTWNRERSAPGCKAVSVQPGPGTYKFTAAIGEFESKPVSFTLE
ncbi:hypothetical protein [Arthrobacter sp. NIO-1057]|uniref:hypothetical protein n=1 Tax=Arthrobacter sp. NIO-1057 TaxID=993071 RepID=UPI00071C4A8B|nr:hypothetical protein [Arthrobacter sp. NIO-1057]KSU63097.1 hypothetical protein AS038_16420 [Arthrobacter sp. NIO-1057]SCC53561.1 hypothetical protein GA0061084_3360 [Arthrobacter sp. NIO-1057]